MFKAGFVSIVGRPNAGKSTLLNALLKQKLSIVSPKPQTTRHKILGILNGKGFQICFLDTPGLLEKSKDLLQVSLQRQARQALRDDPDLVVLVVEPGQAPPEIRPEAPLLLAVNKIDQAKPEAVETSVKALTGALKPAAVFRLSALKGEGVPALLEEIAKRLPESPAFYEEGQVSDRWERFFAAELIREQVFDLYQEEIPHATAVVIDQFKEGRGKADEVHATLYVERDGQKGIIVGKGGKILRALQDASRRSIEKFLGRGIELDLWVKVRKDWRKDSKSLKEFGY